MSTQIVTLESPIAVPLPPEAAKALGLHAGSQVAITIRDRSIILEPLSSDGLDKRPGILSSTAHQQPLAGFDDIKALRGILASEKGMVEELQQERRRDTW